MPASLTLSARSPLVPVVDALSHLISNVPTAALGPQDALVDGATALHGAQAILAKLVTGSTWDAASTTEHAHVQEWSSLVLRGFDAAVLLPALNQRLERTSYVAGTHPTIADLLLYFALKQAVSAVSGILFYHLSVILTATARQLDSRPACQCERDAMVRPSSAHCQRQAQGLLPFNPLLARLL